MSDKEVILSYSDLQDYLNDPESLLSKRIAQVAESKEEPGTKGGRVDFLADEPFDFNYDSEIDEHNLRREERDQMDELPKRYSLEEKIDMEYNPDPGIDWGKGD